MSVVFIPTIMAALQKKRVECPNHNGAFDCTPFCPLCHGEQEYQERKL